MTTGAEGGATPAEHALAVAEEAAGITPSEHLVPTIGSKWIDPEDDRVYTVTHVMMNVIRLERGGGVRSHTLKAFAKWRPVDTNALGTAVHAADESDEHFRLRALAHLSPEWQYPGSVRVLCLKTTIGKALDVLVHDWCGGLKRRLGADFEMRVAASSAVRAMPTLTKAFTAIAEAMGTMQGRCILAVQAVEAAVRRCPPELVPDAFRVTLIAAIEAGIDDYKGSWTSVMNMVTDELLHRDSTSAGAVERRAIYDRAFVALGTGAKGLGRPAAWSGCRRTTRSR